MFDTLAQIHLIRGRYDTASDFLGRASEAYGAYGRQTSQWYEWSVRVLGARLALRRGALDEAVARADEILQAGAPPFDALQATLIAAEALTAANRLAEAEQRLATAADALDPKVAPAAWGEYLRLRGALHAKTGSAADAYHDFAQSATLLDLLGERYQAALSHLALGRLVAETGARSVAERHLNKALGDLRAARRRTRPRRHARRAVAADHDRHRRIRHLAGRRRRCDRAADCGCGGAAGSAGPRDGGGAARSRRPATAASSSSSSPAATSAWSRPPAAIPTRRARWRGRPGTATPTAAARCSSNRSDAIPRARASGWSPRRGRSATRSCAGCG